jgi:hypothetical protein
MFKEPVTALDPNALSDKELLRFSEDFINGEGMPRSFQKEIVARLALKTN